jgi:hypothetical protein
LRRPGEDHFIPHIIWLKEHARLLAYLTVLCIELNGINPTDRQKERKLLMILTVALLNGPFIACTLYKRKIAPTVSKIKKEIEDTIKISKSTLTLTLLDLGYKCKKIRR